MAGPGAFMPEANNHYAVLGLKPDGSDATRARIREQYKKGALQYHPDRNRSPGAEAQFKRISTAYDVLSNTDSRSAYDHDYRRSTRHSDGHDQIVVQTHQDIFEGFFGTRNVEEAEVGLHSGALVRLVGMGEGVDGLRGICHSWDSPQSLWMIILDADEECCPLSIPRCNLNLAEDESSEASQDDRALDAQPLAGFLGVSRGSQSLRSIGYMKSLDVPCSEEGQVGIQNWFEDRVSHLFFLSEIRNRKIANDGTRLLGDFFPGHAYAVIETRNPPQVERGDRGQKFVIEFNEGSGVEIHRLDEFERATMATGRVTSSPGRATMWAGSSIGPLVTARLTPWITSVNPIYHNRPSLLDRQKFMDVAMSFPYYNLRNRNCWHFVAEVAECNAGPCVNPDCHLFHPHHNCGKPLPPVDEQ